LKCFFLSSTDFPFIGNLAALCAPYGAEKRFPSPKQDSAVVSKTWLAIQLPQSEQVKGTTTQLPISATERTCPKAADWRY